MPELRIQTRGGETTMLASREIERLASMLRGDVAVAGTPPYEETRHIWNRMAERRPALFARCRSASDVLRAIRFAREHDLLVSVRGGGHNIGGNALVENGMVIDLSPMRATRVDPLRRVARAEGGVTLGEFDRDTQTFSMATPLGINSTTGIAGLTLGGGYGWLSRSLGLTVDNLLSADVVTADGAFITASEQENSDLFWALRGGGGNFGIVTSFEYRLHPVGADVLAGLIVHPFDDAPELLRRYRDVVQASPDALSAWVVMRQAPPLPVLPAAVHGTKVLVIAVCYAGDLAAGERALRPLRAIGTPHADVVGPTSYLSFQTAFDPLLAPGARNYWKTRNFSTLPDQLIDTLVAQVGELPGPQSEIILAQLGGAISRKAEDATAYMGRTAQFVMNVHARWDDDGADDRFVAWARGVFSATEPFAAGGAYVNFLTQEEGGRVREAYGSNYDRLAAIKAKYDPMNVLRINQNIVPAAAPIMPRGPGRTAPASMPADTTAPGSGGELRS